MVDVRDGHISPLPEKLGLTTTYFDLPGLRVHAAVAGPADGIVLILLHGFPQSWYGWRHQIGPLAQAGYRVVAPDQRGYNLTDKTPPYDLQTLVKDVVHLMDACGCGRAHVAGHNWGGVVAWGLARRYPERVSKLAILNASHPSVMRRALMRGNLRQLLKSWYIFFFQIPSLPEWVLSLSNFAALRRGMRASSKRGTFGDEDLERYVDGWAQPGAIRAMLGWYRAAFRWGLSRSLSGGAPRRLPMPTVIVWGERDVALGVELAEQSLTRLEQGRLIRLPEATHWVNEDFPDEVNRHLLAHFGPP